MRTLSTDDLIALAGVEGVSVEWHNIGPKGLWVPTRGIISLRHGLSEVQARCTLAHELGHVRYDHPGGHDPRHERDADRFAARLLISPAEYALAEQTYGPHPARLAAELDVTVHLIETCRDMWEEKRRAA